MRRARALLATLILAGLLAGCQSAPDATPDAAPSAAPGETQVGAAHCLDATGPIAGQIVYAGLEGLYASAADGGGQALLLAPPQGHTLADPAWSPDGKTLAYVLGYPNPIKDLAWFQLSVLCGLDAASGKARLLVDGGRQTALEQPAWTPDGRAIVAATRRYRFDQAGAPLGEFATISRFELAGGAEQTLAESGRYPALSADGTQLAYVQISPDNYAMTLMLADAQGQGARQLLAPKNPLATLQEPRWSPDGRQIAFTMSADEQPGAPAPTPAAQRSLIDHLLGVEVAHAHGRHAIIWAVAPDGSGLAKLAPAWLDEPHIAWSPDGRIAYTSAAGALSALDHAAGQPQTLVQHGAYGGLTWR